MTVPREGKPWEYLPALDGIRGLAALMVLVCHALRMPGSQVSKPIYDIAYFGVIGVDLFFVLSGFLITGILLSVKGTVGAWKNFYIRRILRIFPLYYGTLIVLTVFSLWRRDGSFELSQTWWFWAYLQNIPMTFCSQGFQGWGVTAHFWSLAVEEHFYLAWPILVFVFRKRVLIRILLAVFAFAVLSRIVMVYLEYNAAYFTFCRLNTISLGALAAILWQEKIFFGRLIKFSKMFLLCLFPILLLLYSAFNEQGHFIIQVVKYSATAGVCCSAMILVLSGQAWGWVGSWLNSKIMRNFGKYSYAIYIFHPFCISFLRNFSLGFWPIDLLLNIGFVYIAAYLSWHLYERHLLSLKRYFEYK